MYFINSKLYLWDTNYRKKNITAKKLQLPSSSAQEVPSLSENKLTNLAWSLDINERIRLDGK
ncbi:hypothetical protein COB18_02720 [Candidatus Kaiserbacteria bacterium]|nr:MAG: hypothetical protein COB18_02720 [Candidatus Kaiserbacteria bacterium]